MDDINDCKDCGNDFYEIRLIYEGRRERLFVIECRECRSHIITVKVDSFTSQNELNKICLREWNKAQITPAITEDASNE